MQKINYEITLKSGEKITVYDTYLTMDDIDTCLIEIDQIIRKGKKMVINYKAGLKQKYKINKEDIEKADAMIGYCTSAIPQLEEKRRAVAKSVQTKDDKKLLYTVNCKNNKIDFYENYVSISGVGDMFYSDILRCYFNKDGVVDWNTYETGPVLTIMTENTGDELGDGDYAVTTASVEIAKKAVKEIRPIIQDAIFGL